MLRTLRFATALCLLSVSSLSIVLAQELPKYEMRGAWIATVFNLDWPRSAAFPPADQQTQLVELLDALQAAGINAVFFQIRTHGEALYESNLEPWSQFLTGTQGKAPEPFYDPLAFAIEEAHKRGMELHAWFNPYRAVFDFNNISDYDTTHIAIRRPDWILRVNDLGILNPGIPDVRNYVVDVVLDVVERYNIDGVHFDDYFYPYPPNTVSNEDQETFDTYNTLGFSSITTWRLFSINMFVRAVYEEVTARKPSLKVGISPFGIWRSGTPSGISGLSAVDAIYADAVNWMEQEWVDYIVPQLYWPFGGGQDFAKLAPWWASVSNDRHIYTGHGVYRSDRGTFGGTLFGADEVPRQIRFIRETPGVQGSVFFRAKNLHTSPSKGFADSLRTDLYRRPALTPPMAWKDQMAPQPPENLVFDWTGDTEVTLSWNPPAALGDVETRRYAVYRVRTDLPPDEMAVIADGRNLIGVTSEAQFVDVPTLASEPYYYLVTSVSANSIESTASNSVTLEGRAVSIETETPSAFALAQNYPNPFSTTTEIQFVLERPMTVSLRVYNALGQEITTLLEDTYGSPGLNSVTWDGNDHSGHPVGSGTYFYTLDLDGEQRTTRGMILIR